MSDQVSASAAGLRLPPDPRSQTYNFNRRRRGRQGSEASPEGEQLTMAGTPSRYRDGASPVGTVVDDAVSFSQTQSAFLGMVGQALDRMGTLSVLCQDATQSDGDRAEFTVEFTQLQHFISDIGTKKFNGVDLFGGAKLQVGCESDGTMVPLNTIEWTGAGSDLGMAIAFDPKSTEVTTNSGKMAALSNVRKALDKLGDMQTKVSTNLQRLNLSSEQRMVLNQNLTAASSRVNDIDWAKRLTDLARFGIIGQAGAAKLAQAANASPQATIRLLDSKQT